VTDAEVLDQVLGLLQSDVDWTEAGLIEDVVFEQWDPDDHPDLDYDELEELARPRIDALRDLFVQRMDGQWQPGAIPQDDEDYPARYHHGWHRGTLSVEIGAVVHDNGLPLMVLLRAYNVTS
jgi:hypothetical protein